MSPPCPVYEYPPLPLETMVPARYGFTQHDAQLPRSALAYPDWAKRARYQAVWPAVWSFSGRNSLADSGRDEMPAVDRSLLMDVATATGSSPSPSRWSLISLGAVPADLTWARNSDHSVAFWAGSAAKSGPTVSALGARLLIVL